MIGIPLGKSWFDLTPVNIYVTQGLQRGNLKPLHTVIKFIHSVSEQHPDIAICENISTYLDEKGNIQLTVPKSGLTYMTVRNKALAFLNSLSLFRISMSKHLHLALGEDSLPYENIVLNEIGKQFKNNIRVPDVPEDAEVVGIGRNKVVFGTMDKVYKIHFNRIDKDSQETYLEPHATRVIGGDIVPKPISYDGIVFVQERIIGITLKELLNNPRIKREMILDVAKQYAEQYEKLYEIGLPPKDLGIPNYIYNTITRKLVNVDFDAIYESVERVEFKNLYSKDNLGLDYFIGGMLFLGEVRRLWEESGFKGKINNYMNETKDLLTIEGFFNRYETMEKHYEPKNELIHVPLYN